MAKNKDLNHAFVNKADEFYTSLTDKEINIGVYI